MKRKTMERSEMTGAYDVSVPFAVEEAYKAARTNLIFSLPGVKCKKIVVTSPAPKEGKSSTAVNMALSIAEMDKKVLLVDVDLRCPTVGKKLGLPTSPGISNILVDFSRLKESIHTVHGVDVLPAGDVPPNPSELLGSAAFRALINQLESEYEYIFFDVPPVCTVTDATMLADIASGTILVVRDGETTKAQIEEALKNLRLVNMKMLGFVIVGTKDSRKKYKSAYASYAKK